MWEVSQYAITLFVEYGRTECFAYRKMCVKEMIDSVNIPRHYRDLIGLVDVMAELSVLNIVNAETAKNHVKNFLNQIEAIVSANIKQENCLITLKPLEVCAMLVGACSHSNINCLEKVKSFLDVYEPGFRKFLSLDIDGLSSGGFKWSVLYHYLGKSLNNDNYCNCRNNGSPILYRNMRILLLVYIKTEPH